jgi:hypothetical protein
LSPSLAKAQSENYLSQIFTEKVLTVTREGDGIFPGTLRALLIQASGIRSQNPFTVVRIVFDPSVKRVRITKGPLPEISGSLTTLDCQTPQGRGLIEGVQENTEGIDPGDEIAGIKLTSNGNALRNCHITGFRGPGVLIRGNRNTVEYDTIGYHKEVSETAVDPSPLFGEPKTNQGSGVFIGDGSSENVVQNNDIVANTFNGVELSGGVGTANKVLYNFFAKNSGRPIKVGASANATRQPQITKIQQQGDLYFISGIAEARANLQIYTIGKDDSEVGMVVVPGTQIPQDTFTVSTKSKGFIPNQTKIVALAQGSNHNTSEFSGAIIIPGPNATTIGTPEGEPLGAPKIEVQPPPKEDGAHDGDAAEGENNGSEPTNGESAKPATSGAGAATNTNNSIITPAIVTSPLPPQAKAADKPNEPETVINLNGAGEPGHEPDTGGLADKTAKVSSLGI